MTKSQRPMAFPHWSSLPGHKFICASYVPVGNVLATLLNVALALVPMA